MISGQKETEKNNRFKHADLHCYWGATRRAKVPSCVKTGKELAGPENLRDPIINVEYNRNQYWGGAENARRAVATLNARFPANARARLFVEHEACLPQTVRAFDDFYHEYAARENWRVGVDQGRIRPEGVMRSHLALTGYATGLGAQRRDGFEAAVDRVQAIFKEKTLADTEHPLERCALKLLCNSMVLHPCVGARYDIYKVLQMYIGVNGDNDRAHFICDLDMIFKNNLFLSNKTVADCQKITPEQITQCLATVSDSDNIFVADYEAYNRSLAKTGAGYHSGKAWLENDLTVAGGKVTPDDFNQFMLSFCVVLMEYKDFLPFLQRGSFLEKYESLSKAENFNEIKADKIYEAFLKALHKNNMTGRIDALDFKELFNMHNENCNATRTWENNYFWLPRIKKIKKGAAFEAPF